MNKMDLKKKQELERRCNVLIARLDEKRADFSKSEMMAQVELIKTLGVIARFGNFKHLAMAKSAKSIINGSLNEYRAQAVLKICEEINFEIDNFKYSSRATYNIGALIVAFTLGFISSLNSVDGYLPSLLNFNGEIIFFSMMFASLTSIVFSSYDKFLNSQPLYQPFTSIFKGALQTFSTAFVGVVFSIVLALIIANFDTREFSHRLFEWFFITSSCFGVWFYKLATELSLKYQSKKQILKDEINIKNKPSSVVKSI
ncbi:hypothetical protein [Pseudoalteromonas sp.]|uniref:hypothetical protein n=1 Tax=Pseudoalteromonas sp. TaxID=53249 RepID=UPI00262478D1|nr:hypothetical protein [Pseudoalteromonas sp.]MCP4586167.1 hypothetical protein [Pseudoalteromonas sp.]